MFSSLSSIAQTVPAVVKAPSNLKEVHAPRPQHGLLPSESQSFQSENRGVYPNEEHRAGPNTTTQEDIPLRELPASTGSSQYILRPFSGYILTQVPSGTLPIHEAGIINPDIANVPLDALHGYSLPPPPYESKALPGVTSTQAEPSSGPSTRTSGGIRNEESTVSGNISYISSSPPLS